VTVLYDEYDRRMSSQVLARFKVHILLSGSVEIRNLRGSIVTRAPVDKPSAADSSANKNSVYGSIFAGEKTFSPSSPKAVSPSSFS
jgi:hypothetical protein